MVLVFAQNARSGFIRFKDMEKAMIYISSSWKNRGAVRELANMLRSSGIEPYDFTDAKCRTTAEIPPERFPLEFDPEIHDYALYLDRREWRSAVEENREALDRCSGVILLLPCGIDATADWAYAVGLGKPSVVVGAPRKGERSPVHLWASAMVRTPEEAVNWFINNAPFCVGDIVRVREPDSGDVFRWDGRIARVDLEQQSATVKSPYVRSGGDSQVSFANMTFLKRTEGDD